VDGVTQSRARAARTQRERSEATVSELLAAARDRFAHDGYAGTSLDAIAAAAGVTKGALYHHFSGKRDLFLAVFEEEQRRLVGMVAEAYSGQEDPWDAFYEGCRAYLEASADPAVQRIVALDAPSALGWDTVREIETQTSFGSIVAGLKRAMKAGRIPERPAEPLAHLLFGAIGEGAMAIATADDQRKALRGVLDSMRALLDALAAEV
jgi:AcrR family transcriptional regulator